MEEGLRSVDKEADISLTIPLEFLVYKGLVCTGKLIILLQARRLGLKFDERNGKANFSSQIML